MNTVPATLLAGEISIMTMTVSVSRGDRGTMRARGTMNMGVGYNGHVYRHVGGTSCVNQHIFNSDMKKNKKIVEIFF